MWWIIDEVAATPAICTIQNSSPGFKRKPVQFNAPAFIIITIVTNIPNNEYIKIH